MGPLDKLIPAIVCTDATMASVGPCMPGVTTGIREAAVQDKALIDRYWGNKRWRKSDPSMQ